MGAPGCRRGAGKASSSPLLLPLCFQETARADSVCKEPSWCTMTSIWGHPGQSSLILMSYLSVWLMQVPPSPTSAPQLPLLFI